MREEKSMNYCEITVQAKDHSAYVSVGSTDLTVSRRDAVGTAGGCPVEYVATALGS